MGSTTRFWLDPVHHLVLSCSWGLTGECQGILPSGAPASAFRLPAFSRWNALVCSAVFTLVRILSPDMIQTEKTSSPRSLGWKQFNTGGEALRLKLGSVSTSVRPLFESVRPAIHDFRIAELWDLFSSEIIKIKHLGNFSAQQERLAFPSKRYQKHNLPRLMCSQAFQSRDCSWITFGPVPNSDTRVSRRFPTRTSQQFQDYTLDLIQ